MMLDELATKLKSRLGLEQQPPRPNQHYSSPTGHPPPPNFGNWQHQMSGPPLTDPNQYRPSPVHTYYGGLPNPVTYNAEPTQPPPLPPRTSSMPSASQENYVQVPPPDVSYNTRPGLTTYPPEGGATATQPGTLFLPGTYPTPDLLPYPIGRHHTLENPTAYTSSAIQAALDALGEQAILYLPQGTRWTITCTITLKAHQEIATFGYPTSEEAMAWLEAGSHTKGYLLRGFGAPGVKIRNLVIDGGREKFGYDEKCEAMVQLGGEGGQNQVLDHCIVRHPRQWSCFQAFEGGQNVRVTNNLFGPAGFGDDVGPDCRWADGISYAASNGLVAGNQVLDATDGAIVIFGAPGTLVTSNTIITRSRVGLGGINMVDYPFDDGNYEGTRVIHNTIRVEGSYLKTGIGQGYPVWWVPDPNTPKKMLRGATVMYNLIESKPANVHSPGAVGYGFPVSQVDNWICTDNTSARDVTYEGGMSEIDRKSFIVNPGPFVCSPGLGKEPRFGVHGGAEVPSPCNRLQKEFVTGCISGLIRIKPGKSSALSFAPGELDLKIGDSIRLQRVELAFERDGELRLKDTCSNQVVWSAGSRHSVRGASDARLVLDRGGKWIIVDSSRVLYDLTPNLPPSGCGEGDGDEEEWKRPQLVISDTMPHISLTSPNGSTIFATSYREKEGWTLPRGSYVSRPSWDEHHTLVSLANARGQYMVLQTVMGKEMQLPIQEPLDPHRWRVLWCSPNPASDCHVATNVVFQGDGNFVIYDADWKPLWATGTCGRDPPAKHIQWGSGSAADPCFAVVDAGGNIVWSTNT